MRKNCSGSKRPRQTQTSSKYKRNKTSSGKQQSTSVTSSNIFKKTNGDKFATKSLTRRQKTESNEKS